MDSVFVALIGSLSTLAAVFITLRWGDKQSSAARERDYRRQQMRDVFTAIINNSVELRHAIRAFQFSEDRSKGVAYSDAMIKYNDEHYRLYALSLLTSPAVSEALIELYEADSIAATTVSGSRPGSATEAVKEAEIRLGQMTRLMRRELDLPDVSVTQVDHLLNEYSLAHPDRALED